MRILLLQPKVIEIRRKYEGDSARIKEETSKLYLEENISPLADFLPTLVQIPLIIALQKSIGQLQIDPHFREGFLWIPSMAGPINRGFGFVWLLNIKMSVLDKGAYLVAPIMVLSS